MSESTNNGNFIRIQRCRQVVDMFHKCHLSNQDLSTHDIPEHLWGEYSHAYSDYNRVVEKIERYRIKIR